MLDLYPSYFFCILSLWKCFISLKGKSSFRDSYQIYSPADERNGTTINTQASGDPLQKVMCNPKIQNIFCLLLFCETEAELYTPNKYFNLNTTGGAEAKRRQENEHAIADDPGETVDYLD